MGFDDNSVVKFTLLVYGEIVTDAETKKSLWNLLGQIPDHRNASGRRFSLRSILAVTISATMAGRDGLAAIARWGRKLTRGQLAEFGITRKKAPCHATYHNVFKGLDITALERALGRWVSGPANHRKQNAVAIDGKTLRASRTQDYPGVHLPAAFSHAVCGVLGQVRVRAETNEIKAALHLLKEIELTDTVVTGDAIFAQKDICRAITKGGGDYFFVVKDNQAALKEHIATAFSAPSSPLGTAAVGARGGHGRRYRQGTRSAGAPRIGEHGPTGGIS